jgi:hypothetical protein
LEYLRIAGPELFFCFLPEDSFLLLKSLTKHRMPQPFGRYLISPLIRDGRFI